MKIYGATFILVTISKENVEGIFFIVAVYVFSDNEEIK